MLGRSVKKRIAELERIAQQQRRDNPYLPRNSWPYDAIAADKEFNRQVKLAESPYEFLINNIDLLPEIPMKPEYQALRGSDRLEDQQKLYYLIKG